MALGHPCPGSDDRRPSRCLGSDAPDKTLAAFQLAWEEGADAIEGDFRLTADRQIVAMHDDHTKRTAGVELEVAASTLEQLRQLDVVAWKGPEFRGQRIPTLEEVLQSVPAGKKILIEIKCGPEIVPPLKQLLASSTLQPSQTIVIAFKQSVIRAVKQQIPSIQAYWLTGYEDDKKTGTWSPSLDQVLHSLKGMVADGLDTQANPQVVDARFIAAIRQAGYEVHAWTIDEPQLARCFQQFGSIRSRRIAPGPSAKLWRRQKCGKIISSRAARGCPCAAPPHDPSPAEVAADQPRTRWSTGRPWGRLDSRLLDRPSVHVEVLDGVKTRLLQLRDHDIAITHHQDTKLLRRDQFGHDSGDVLHGRGLQAPRIMLVVILRQVMEGQSSQCLGDAGGRFEPLGKETQFRRPCHGDFRSRQGSLPARGSQLTPDLANAAPVTSLRTAVTRFQLLRAR